MRVFISGAAGYLGAELVRQLVERDKSIYVVVFDNFSRNNFSFLIDERVRESGRISVFRGDVLDHISMREAMEGCDLVVHLAGIIPDHVNTGTPHLFDQVNNWGSANLVRVANEIRPSLVLFTSSLKVFGARHNLVARDHAPAPTDAYGLSKLYGENQFTALRPEIPHQVVRLGNLYGLSAQTRFDSLVNKMVLEAKYSGTIMIQGSGAQCRPILPVAFAASKLAEVLLSEPRPAEPYPLAVESPSLETVAQTIRQELPDTDIRFVNRAVQMPSLRLSDDLHVGPNSQRIVAQIPKMISQLI